MADRVVEKTETVQKEPSRDTVVIHDNPAPQEKGSNAGLIIAIIILVIILLLVFGRGLIGGGGSSGGSTGGGTSTGGSVYSRLLRSH